MTAPRAAVVIFSDRDDAQQRDEAVRTAMKVKIDELYRSTYQLGAAETTTDVFLILDRAARAEDARAALDRFVDQILAARPAQPLVTT